MFGWILRMFSRNAPLPVPQPSLCAGRGRGREVGNTLREVDQMWKGRPSQRCRQPAACSPAGRCSSGHSFLRAAENTCHATRLAPPTHSSPPRQVQGPPAALGLLSSVTTASPPVLMLLQVLATSEPPLRGPENQR